MAALTLTERRFLSVRLPAANAANESPSCGASRQRLAPVRLIDARAKVGNAGEVFSSSPRKPTAPPVNPAGGAFFSTGQSAGRFSPHGEDL